MKITTIGNSEDTQFGLGFESEEHYFAFISTLETMQRVLANYGRVNEKRRFLSEWLRDDINMIAEKIHKPENGAHCMISLLQPDELADFASLMTAVSATILVCANETIDSLMDKKREIETLR